MDLCQETSDDGQKFKFLGLWSKNKWQWHTAMLACMHYKMTAIGFYDAQGPTSVDFILKQTELKTIVCAGEYVQKISDMKK